MGGIDAKWGFYPAAQLAPVDAQGRRKPTKYVGRTTGMGVEQYQDYTLYINEDRDGRLGRRLTDEQLCADWQHEFPEAVRFTLFHVDGVRRDFVRGKVRDSSGSSHGVRDGSGNVIGGAPSKAYA